MKPLTALDVASYILANYPEHKLSPLKLQKLVFYVKVWDVVAEKGITQIDFKHWKHGPVNTSLYQAYKAFGAAGINAPTTHVSINNAEVKVFLDLVVGSYITHSAVALSAMTHQEAPWQQTQNNAVITDSAIYDFYKEQPFAKNFDPDNASYHIIQDDGWSAFTLDMNPADAAALANFASFEDYQKELLKAEQELEQQFQAFQYEHLA